MQRRDLLKGFALAGTAGLWLPRWAGAEGAAPTAPAPVRAIRGLVRGDGPARQPIRITPPASGTSRLAITRVDGMEVDRRTVAAGEASFDILVPAVDAAKAVRVESEVGGAHVVGAVTLQPVRKMLVYVLPHSHHDLGYTEHQADVEDHQVENIRRGIAMADATSGYVEGARFVWNLEVLWGADLYLKRGNAADRDAFIDAVRSGKLALNGAYANELTGICRPEELLRLFRFGQQLAAQTGTPVNAAMISDVPGYTWGTVEAMAQAGIRYFSAAPNYFDRIGRFMATWQDRPFWWVSRSGRSRVLFWVPWTGYAMSHVMSADVDWVGAYQARLDEVGFRYDIAHVRWAGHGDNAPPDQGISDFVRDWNTRYAWPRFQISGTSEAFTAFERKHGDALPQLRGDLTPYWEDGAASSARETALNRNTADTLVQAAALAAMHGKPFDGDAAWRDVLLYSEHTWGAAHSVTRPEEAMTVDQWRVKRAFADDAAALADGMVAARSPAHATTHHVTNTTGWERGGLVCLPAGAGDRLTLDGHVLPSQRLHDGRVAAWLPPLPPLATVAVHRGEGSAGAPPHAVSFDGSVLDNGLVSARIDPATGNLASLRRHGIDHEFLATDAAWSANQFVYMAGDAVNRLQTTSQAVITVEEAGPFVVSVLVTSSAPSCRSLTRRIRLMAGADWLEIENTIDKTRAPYEEVPDPNHRGKTMQAVAKESLQFAFPFAVPGGRMHVDVPLGQMEPEADQLPGACRNWMPVGRYVDVANDALGVTWMTLDAPLIEVGGVTATKLNSQTDPSVWMDRLAPSQTVMSWVMNNHWGTNYRAWQEGPVRFRYALRPHGARDDGLASRLATGMTQPLLVDAAAPSAPLLRIEPEDVQLQSITPSSDGKAFILRLFGASGSDRRARLHWSGPVGKASLSNLAEAALAPVQGDIAVGGWQLVSVRVERG
ncbi:hypothetical protein FIV34_20490 [Luteibacter pinisoli]|uniref:Glycoside hydrolase family 38 N-terminal domain-containing protein n=1 Tax=Luteibacter pinisoli TaxID=2589080 RepID=A0A4Y5Z867_9GAMM|nr:glycoside hydrolase family 38 C-terminal domain-containing protein [Luteibacter pinisoli]QDE41407.1 hypothetical protein FIV34_20490 [Luteibacter pinisoli]